MLVVLCELCRERSAASLVPVASCVDCLARRVAELGEERDAIRTLLDAVCDAPLKVDILKSQQDALIAERDALRKVAGELMAAMRPFTHFVPDYITDFDRKRAAAALASAAPLLEAKS